MTATVQTIEKAEKESLLKKTFQASEQLAKTVVHAERIKAQLAHAVEDATVQAQRYAKQTRRAAEDLADETAYCIKRDPLRAVSVAVGAGFALGALAGWALTRPRNCQK